MSTKKKKAESVVVEAPAPPPLDSSRLMVYKEELNRRQFNNYTKRKRSLEKRLDNLLYTTGKYNEKAAELVYCALTVYRRENKRYVTNQSEAWMYSAFFFEQMEKEEMR